MAPRKTTAAELARIEAGDAPEPAEAAAAPPPAKAPAKKKASKRPRDIRIAPMPQPGIIAQPPRALEQTDYLPDPTRHMSEAGPVATSNFICRIGATRISVRMGAPRSSIPKEIQALMAESDVSFGIAAPPAHRGATVIEAPDDDDAGGPPRARRSARKRDRDPGDRPFKPLRSLPIE
jgi:hypothetical protein